MAAIDRFRYRRGCQDTALQARQDALAMLTSLIAMTALLLSEGVSHYASGTPVVETAVAARNPLYKPEDPSTMTLALIGAATFAVYFGSRRAARARRTITLSQRGSAPFESLAQTPVESAGEAAEQPSRGAA